MADTGKIRAALSLVSGAPLDIDARRGDMLRQMRKAEEAGARLLVFPKDCLTGAEAGDLAKGALRFKAYEAVRALCGASGNCLCVLNFLYKQGEKYLTAAAFVRDGKFLLLSLPDDAEMPADILSGLEDIAFDAPFAVAREGLLPIADGVALGAAFDEDTAKRLAGRGATLIAYPAAQPARALRHPSRGIGALSRRLSCGILYCNAGEDETSTDSVYAGERTAAHSGNLTVELPAFSGQDMLLCDMDLSLPPWGDAFAPDIPFDPRMPYAPIAGPQRARWCEEALEIAARGLALRMRRIGASAAILGLSGGIDSAMALLVSSRALNILGLPVERLMAWSLPCFGTSGRTRGNSLRLMAALGLPQREIDISGAVGAHLRDIGHDGRHDAAFENAQARERTQVLMDLANMHGGIMVGPGDMSELALGFTTFSGDHMSMYGVNAGLYKSAIRLIAGHISDREDGSPLGLVLRDILDTPISPELLPGGQEKQQTEKLLGGYELNDFFLWHLLGGEGARGILRAAGKAFGDEFGPAQLVGRLESFIRRFFASQFKRSCAPDGPQILGHSLSPRGGFAMPSDASPAAWLEDIRQASMERDD